MMYPGRICPLRILQNREYAMRLYGSRKYLEVALLGGFLQEKLGGIGASKREDDLIRMHMVQRLEIAAERQCSC